MSAMLNSTLPRSGTRPKWERADAQRRRARVGTMLNSTLPRSRVPVSERFSSLYLRTPRHGGRHLACTMPRCMLLARCHVACRCCNLRSAGGADLQRGGGGGRNAAHHLVCGGGGRGKAGVCRRSSTCRYVVTPAPVRRARAQRARASVCVCGYVRVYACACVCN